MTVCRQLRAVDIGPVLPMLARTAFVDTGGTNGHIAQPDWLLPFVASLGLGGHVASAVVRKLPAYQGIPAHVDRSVEGERRFHVPLVTDPAVTMRWPDDHTVVHLEAGYLYEVRFDQRHEIVHQAPIDRIHVQVNIVHSTEEAL